MAACAPVAAPSAPLRAITAALRSRQSRNLEMEKGKRSADLRTHGARGPGQGMMPGQKWRGGHAGIYPGLGSPLTIPLRC